VSEEAEKFREMAARIDKNAGEPFAGAALIIPPEGGDPIEILILDPTSGVAAQFWGFLKQRIDIELIVLDKAERGGR
jgi:hypothetical protein